MYIADYNTWGVKKFTFARIAPKQCDSISFCVIKNNFMLINFIECDYEGQ